MGDCQRMGDIATPDPAPWWQAVVVGGDGQWVGMSLGLMELAVPPLPHHQGLSFWILLSLVLCQAAVVASVLCTGHTVRFPSLVTLFPLLAYPFPMPGQSSFYLSPHIFGFTRRQKESV